MRHLALTLIIGATACGGASFSGKSSSGGAPEAPAAGASLPPGPAGGPEGATPPSQKSPDSVAVPLSLPCGSSGAGPSVVVRATDHLLLSGDLCLAGSGSPSVVFVVDMSGSMAAEKPANDPIRAGSCGRLSALRAVTTELAKNPVLAQSTDVTMIGFSATAAAQFSGEKPEEALKKLTVDNVCRSLSWTDYAVAIDLVEAPANDKQLVVYLISDGLPKNAAGDARRAGLEAALRLRARAPNVIINAVYLGSEDLDADPARYLGEITKSEGRVLLVKDAQKLPQEILKFSPPAALDPAALVATLTLPGGTVRKVELDSLAPDATVPGLYHYGLSPITLPTAVDSDYRLEIRSPSRSEPLVAESFHIEPG